jgi:hypothetical protein
MRTGIEPMREFHAAARAREANERVYVAAGEITDNARAFAAEKGHSRPRGRGARSRWVA